MTRRKAGRACVDLAPSSAEDGLTQRQIDALNAVANSASLKVGLEAAGVHRSTWHRWMEDHGFSDAFEEIRKQARREAAINLRDGVGAAVGVLLKLLDSKNEQIQLSAAKTVLEMAKGGLETEAITQKLDRIERLIVTTQPAIHVLEGR